MILVGPPGACFGTKINLGPILRWGLLTLLQLPHVALLSLSLALLLISGCLGTNVGAPLAISRDSRQGEYSKSFFLGTPSEIKTVLCGKNSHVGRPPPPPVWEFFRKNAVFF